MSKPEWRCVDGAVEVRVKPACGCDYHFVRVAAHEDYLIGEVVQEMVRVLNLNEGEMPK